MPIPHPDRRKWSRRIKAPDNGEIAIGGYGTKKRGLDITLHEFMVAEGADANCQLNNFRLLHLVVFDWLDLVFDWKAPSSIPC